MNKKGFTLIELLAAVSVLALLVVIIIPSVTDLYNDAKKNVFVNECRNIYKSARSSYVYDNVRTSESFAYANGVENTGTVQLKKLNLSGDNKMTYIVQFDSEGNIVYFFATDGNYEFESGEINVKGRPISINDFDDTKVTEPTTPTGGGNGSGGGTVTITDPVEPGSGDGGEVTPLDPGYDPDDPNNPDDPDDPFEPGTITPITPGSIYPGEDVEYTVTQTTVSNTNTCPKQSGYLKSQSGNNIIVKIYFKSNMGNPS